MPQAIKPLRKLLQQAHLFLSQCNSNDIETCKNPAHHTFRKEEWPMRYEAIGKFGMSTTSDF